MISLTGPYRVHVIGCDHEQRDQRWLKPVRRMPWYLLVGNLEGEENLRVNGETKRIGPGEAYLIPPGARCEIGSNEGNTLAWIHFEVVDQGGRRGTVEGTCHPDEWAELSTTAQPLPQEVWGVDLPVRIPPSLCPHFSATVPEVVRLWKKHHPLSTLEAHHMLAGLILNLVAEVWNHSRQETRPDLADRLRRAENVARERLGGNFGVTEWAAAAGLSRSRFSVLYQRHNGRTPGSFLRELRIRQAERLLLETDLGVSDIAAMVGYSDPSVFGRVFRKFHGQTPLRWRISSDPEARDQLAAYVSSVGP
ncbi:MAG: helix-turn-helix domain-containing protein [Opitutales bacterium]|nr:helix-turn-helix domain-containing protein [Opitutales bacterium]